MEADRARQLAGLFIERVRADAPDGAISQFSMYCTGDGDEAQRAKHAASVTLIRP